MIKIHEVKRGAKGVDSVTAIMCGVFFFFERRNGRILEGKSRTDYRLGRMHPEDYYRFEPETMKMLYEKVCGIFAEAEKRKN